MIGHVFATSGAVCLALAPSAERGDEYIVLAKYDGQYAVANVLTEKMPEPTYWLHGTYTDSLDEAIDIFREMAGLSAPADTLHANIEAAELVASRRQAIGNPA